MKLIKYTAAALTLASFTPAQESALYEVTHLIIESTSAVDVWTSEHFVRTDIQVTSDSIHYFEAVGEYNKMLKTESTDYSNVLSITDSSLTVQQPDEVITYLLYNLQNHYE